MNNLLRTLTNSQVKNASGTDLKLLLTSVKEARKQASDSKYTDAFFDSLEGILLDLRTVTIDNRDAEAFLKPVTKSEVPDYYDVIHNPMDLQTMLKRVKQKQYKSKREFKDDLDLIWSNCRTYNAAETHPLRECARRLELKAEKLLASITDRKERLDPIIPFAANGTTKMVNGHTPKSRHTSPSSSTGTPSRTLPPLAQRKHAQQQPSSAVNFEDSPALLRTASGMALFRDLDHQVQDFNEDDMAIIEKLRDLTAPHFIPDAPPEHEDSQPADGSLGDKRKLNGSSDHHPRKRARYTPSAPLALYPTDSTDVTALWWSATQSNTLLANGLPLIPCISSSPSKRSGKRPLFPQITPPSDPTSTKPKGKRKRKAKPPTTADNTPPPPKALLTMMNSNIHTIKRVRRAHAKYAALNLTAAGPANEDGEPDAPVPVIQQPVPLAFPGGAGTADEDLGVGAVLEDTTVDERAWKIKRGGVEIGAENATGCLDWVNGKILHHAGFQGGSKNALSVMSSVLGEYLTNVGQTIKYMSEKHANTMTPEEIILHTLFESGIPKIQDLEQYISDDIERHGGRLADLEKKIVGAYTEATATDVVNEDLFDENEEEDGAFLLGNFADAIGDDFLGLRALGIADELGMTSLTIPRRLLRGKKDRNAAAAAKASEPALPYPLPPPFVPLSSDQVEDQIGLLRPYYESRFAALAPAYPIPPPPLPPSDTMPVPASMPVPMEGVTSTPASGTTADPSAPAQPMAQPGVGTEQPMELSPPGPPEQPDFPTLIVLTLLDDQPNPVNTKMGPLGQINKSTSSTAQSKKKATQAQGASARPALVAPPMTMANSAANSSYGENIQVGISNGVNGMSVRAGTPMSVDSPSTPTKKKGHGTPGRPRKNPPGPGPGADGPPNPGPQGYHPGVVSAYA